MIHHADIYHFLYFVLEVAAVVLLNVLFSLGVSFERIFIKTVKNKRAYIYIYASVSIWAQGF